jgi:hypothetical protein
MVPMHVSYEDFHSSMEASSCPYHLPLDAFAAVEHYLLAFTLYQNGR